VKRPQKELRGFQRVSLQPGEKKNVTLNLPVEQLAFYDVKSHRFVVEPGTFELLAGSSSRDIRGKCRLEVVPPGK
jgi:beta-glucosidase